MIELLVVEDNDGDVVLFEKAFEQIKAGKKLQFVADGEEALNFLFRKKGYEEAHRPDLVLLDLNLPKVNGREVLKVIKSDPELKAIPVIVFTSSLAEKDIFDCYDLHANSYVIKPMDYYEFLETIRKLAGFWFEAVKFPARRQEEMRE